MITTWWSLFCPQDQILDNLYVLCLALWAKN